MNSPPSAALFGGSFPPWLCCVSCNWTWHWAAAFHRDMGGDLHLPLNPANNSSIKCLENGGWNTCTSGLLEFSVKRKERSKTEREVDRDGSWLLLGLFLIYLPWHTSLTMQTFKSMPHFPGLFFLIFFSAHSHPVSHHTAPSACPPPHTPPGLWSCQWRPYIPMYRCRCLCMCMHRYILWKHLYVYVCMYICIKVKPIMSRIFQLEINTNM